jgi:hypothetical protein
MVVLFVSSTDPRAFRNSSWGFAQMSLVNQTQSFARVTQL